MPLLQPLQPSSLWQRPWPPSAPPGAKNSAAALSTTSAAAALRPSSQPPIDAFCSRTSAEPPAACGRAGGGLPEPLLLSSAARSAARLRPSPPFRFWRDSTFFCRFSAVFHVWKTALATKSATTTLRRLHVLPPRPVTASPPATGAPFPAIPNGPRRRAPRLLRASVAGRDGQAGLALWRPTSKPSGRCWRRPRRAFRTRRRP